MISKTGKDFDIILVTAEPYEDHPLSPAGVLARVLEAEGYCIGIIESPQTDEDFQKLGRPRLFLGITSGSVDSMLNNFTPLKKRRMKDPYANCPAMPDRAILHYSNKYRQLMKGVPLVIGGVEASLRRLAHYDY